MALTMARPYKHPKTGIYWLRKVVPAPLRPAVGQRELKASLRTKDPEAAKVEARVALDRFDAILATARAKVLGTFAVLSLREITAAVGVAYREEVARWADDPGTAEHWAQHLDYYSEHFQPDVDDEHGPRTFTADTFILDKARDILTRQGITADPANVRRTAEVWAREQITLGLAMQRRVEGDWQALTGAERFPGPPPASPTPAPVAVPLGALLDGWALETGKKGKALYDRQRTAVAFTAFLGHDDAARVTADDVVSYKEARIAAGRSLKTVANDINELSPIWRWAKRNRKLAFTENPFAGLAPQVKATSRRARDPYTDAEACLLLVSAREQTGLLRWLPWLLCFTAARLGEACQSVKEDFAPIPGHRDQWALHIHEDGPGRSLKTPQSHRFVPLHPALIREGFLSYLDTLPAGSPIFPLVGLDKFGTRMGRASNKHAAWVRKTVGITDTRKDPAHAWRHLFEDRTRRAGMPKNVADALMGHLNAANESEGYGRGFRFMPETTAGHVASMGDPSQEAP